MIDFTKETAILDLVKEFYENFYQSTKHIILGKLSKSTPLIYMNEILGKLVFLIALFYINSARSNNYYFSASTGNDSYTSSQAQNPVTPWKTLYKLNSFMVNLQAGDSILFKRGEVFYGSLIVTVSGKESNPIVFSAYGTGTKPILSGLTTLTNWTAQGSNKWEADCPNCGTSVNMLLLNEIPQSLGRYPNTTDPNKGYLTFEYSTPLQITDNELKASPDWTGGELVVRSSRWTMDHRTIQSHIGNTINYNLPTSYPLTNNYGYFIQKHPSTLDTYGEWYYEPITKKILLYTDSINPALLSILVATQNVLIEINNTNYIRFDGIECIGANTIAINSRSSNYVSITNCDINFSAADAVLGYDISNFIFENNTIMNTSNRAISLGASNNTVIKNNFIKNTGITAGAGKDSGGNYSGIQLTGNNNRIEYNTIDSTGYIPICFQGDSFLIKNNFINNFAFTLDDGGGIYTWNGCPSNPNGIYGVNHFDRKIIGNIVLNGIGAPEGTNSNNHKAASGIYLDDNTMNVEVYDNTIANCALNGIFLHNSSKNLVNKNTLFNNNLQLKFEGSGNCTTDPIQNNTVQNNILFSKLASQTVLSLTANAINNINVYGQFDTNYYCRPFNEQAIIAANSNLTENYYSLSQWQSASGNDYNSKITPILIPSYNVNNLSDANIIPNGTFDSNISGASSWSPQNNCTISWDNTAGLDGGTLKYSFTSVTSKKNNSLLIIAIGTIVSGKNYILKFSLKGTKNNTSMGVNLRKSSSPYTNLTSFQYTNITSDIMEHEILFSPQISETNSSLQFEIKEADGPLWFDNIELFEADVTLTDPDNYISLEYNSTQSDKKIPLAGDYIDVKNNLYSESLTLPPFASVLLLKKMPFRILKTQDNDKINEIILYPNPFNNFFLIKSDKLIKETVVYNILGEILFTLQSNTNVVEVKTPQLPQGVYFIKSNIDGNWLTSKLIKQ